MKHSQLRRGIAMTAFLSLMCPIAVTASESTLSVALKPMPLPIAGQAFTTSDINIKHGAVLLSPKNGTVLPREYFDVTGKSHELKLLGASLTFSGVAANVTMSLDDGKALPIPSFRDGLVNVPLPVAQKGTILAVPVIMPSKNGYKVFYRSGSVVAGKIKSSSLFLYDDNFDGVYSQTNDMLSVDSGVVFAPISKHIATADGLISVTAAKEDGSSLDYNYSTSETAKVDIRFVNPFAEAHAVFTGPEGTTLFVTGGKAQHVIPGNYKLSHGLLVNSKTGVTYAAIVPGKSEAVTVNKGEETTKAVFGGPFTGEIPLTVSSASGTKTKLINIRWPAIDNFHGKNGERYVGYRFKGDSANVFINGKPSGTASPPC
jgi:hypothetical protein